MWATRYVSGCFLIFFVFLATDVLSDELEPPISSLTVERLFKRGDVHLDLCSGMGDGALIQQSEKEQAGHCWAALSILQLAASRGNATAARKLGWMYSEGIFVPKDLDVGLEFYRLAAELGDADAMFRYAATLKTTAATKQDWDVVFMYLERASENGVLPAQLVLAKTLAEHGTLERSAAWLLVACHNGAKRVFQEEMSVLRRNSHFHVKRVSNIAHQIIKRSPMSVTDGIKLGNGVDCALQ